MWDIYTTAQLLHIYPNISVDDLFGDVRVVLSEKSITTLIIFCAYSLLFLVGTVGNGWVATIIGRLLWSNRGQQGGKENSTAQGMQVYIFALCCCDLFVLACSLLLLVDLMFGSWTINSSLVCKIYLNGESLNKFGAPFLLTALSGFCYLSICKGKRVNVGCLSFELNSNKTALVVVGVCAFLAAVLAAPVNIFGDVHFLVAMNNTTLLRIVPKCSIQMPESVTTIFALCGFAFGFCMPAIAFTFFYSALLYRLHAHAKRMRERKAKYFWRVAKTSMCLVVFYLVCWTPYWIMSVWQQFRSSEHAQSAFSLYMSLVIHLLPYVNLSGYPILYTFSNRNIKEDYTRMRYKGTLRRHARLQRCSTASATNELNRRSEMRKRKRSRASSAYTDEDSNGGLELTVTKHTNLPLTQTGLEVD